MHKNLFLLGISAMLIFAVSFSYAVKENDIVVYYSFDKLNYSLDNFKFWTILSFLETKSRKEGILSIYIFLKG